MSFNDNVSLDTSQVSSGGGGGGGAPGGLVVGGGLGGIVVLILTLLFNGVFGGNDGSTAGLDPTQVGAAGSEDPNAFSAVQDGRRRERGHRVPHRRNGELRAGLLGLRGCPASARSGSRRRP